jgi:hypothetical protein
MKLKRKANPNLKRIAKAYARPLETRPRDMAKLKQRQTMREEHLMNQEMLHKKTEHDKINQMLNQSISPQLRSAFIKQRAALVK